LDPDAEQDPDPDPLVRGEDPRIRIRTKMSRIPNTASRDPFELLDPDPHFECGSGSRRAKMTHKYRKSFEVLKCWMFSFEG
jgi:hypothetical protein